MSEAPETIAAMLRHAAQQLDGASVSARLDAEVLLADCLERSRSFLHAHGGETLSPATRERFLQ